MALRPEFEPCRLGTFYFGSQFQGHTPDMLCAHMAEKITYFPVKTNCALLRSMAVLEQHLQQIFSQLNKVKLNLFIYNTQSYFII